MPTASLLDGPSLVSKTCLLDRPITTFYQPYIVVSLLSSCIHVVTHDETVILEENAVQSKFHSVYSGGFKGGGGPRGHAPQDARGGI